MTDEDDSLSPPVRAVLHYLEARAAAYEAARRRAQGRVSFANMLVAAFCEGAAHALRRLARRIRRGEIEDA